MKIYEIENKKEALEEIWKLTYEAYLQEGYCNFQSNGMLRHYSNLDLIPETRVFVAEEDEIILGTNSLTIDGPQGLHTDYTFKSITDEYRHISKLENRTLASSWRIVTKENCRNKRKIVLNLIDRTLRGFEEEGADICLFTFNPKHERFYQRTLGFKTISQSNDKSVNAPAILMQGDIKTMRAYWNKFYKKRKKSQNIPLISKNTLQTMAQDFNPSPQIPPYT